MAIDKTRQIIRNCINDQIAFNIMDLKDCKKMWDRLKSIYTEII